MTRELGNWITFCLCVTLVVIALMGLLIAQERTPLATQAEKALAPLMVSTDGKTVTFRQTAIDTLRICVEPQYQAFGRGQVCFTVGDVRSGRWGRK